MEEPYVLLFAAGWLISLICTGSLIHEAKKTGNTAARRVNRIILGIAIALLWRSLERTDFKRRPDLARALVGVVLLLGHLIVGVYCLSRPGHAGYDWFYF